MSEYVHVVVEHEELFPAVLHDVLAEVVDEIGDGDGLAVLVVGWDGELVLALVREEHLEAAPEESQYMTFCLLPLFFVFPQGLLSIARGFATWPLSSRRGSPHVKNTEKIATLYVAAGSSST